MDQVECKICGRLFSFLPSHLRSAHSLSSIEYLGGFPGTPISSIEFQESSRRGFDKGREVFLKHMEEDPEWKSTFLESSFHSKSSRVKANEGQVRSWESLSLEARSKRVQAAAEGVRKASLSKSESMKSYWAGLSDEERYIKYRESFGSDESLRKVGEGSKRAWDSYTPEEKLDRLNSSVQSEGGKRNRKLHWENLSEDEKREWVKVHLRGSQGSQTEPEVWLEGYLNNRFPGEWLYNGSGVQGVVLGGKIPDFVNVNGKKSVIEVFGTYWHSEEEVEEKIKHYKQFGFDCKVVWEYDCYLWNELDRLFGVVV